VKAITIFQPYASLIACEAKQFETRSWPTTHRGPLAIHAAKKRLKAAAFPPWYWKLVFEKLTETRFDELPFASVIATADIAGCYQIQQRTPEEKATMTTRAIEIATGEEIVVKGSEILFGEWHEGWYAWKLNNVQKLSEPVPARGQQGFWNWKQTPQIP